MAERPAVNASPLIFLAKAGRLNLLQLAGSRLVVPQAVFEEIARGVPDDPTASAVRTTDWIEIVPPQPIPPIIQAWDLGVGESAVLAWAHQYPGTEAIIDDLAARRCAAALGIQVRGTLGLVLVAKRRGIIPAARPVVDELRRAGMYLSDRVVNEALTLTGE